MIKTNNIDVTNLSYVIWCEVKSQRKQKTIFFNKDFVPTLSAKDATYKMCFDFINKKKVSSITLFSLEDDSHFKNAVTVTGSVLEHFLQQHPSEKTLTNRRSEILNGNYKLSIIKRYMVDCIQYVIS